MSHAACCSSAAIFLCDIQILPLNTFSCTFLCLQWNEGNHTCMYKGRICFWCMHQLFWHGKGPVQCPALLQMLGGTWQWQVTAFVDVEVCWEHQNRREGSWGNFLPESNPNFSTPISWDTNYARDSWKRFWVNVAADVQHSTKQFPFT